MGRDCDFWKNKLVGKIILEDDKEITLSEEKYIRMKELPQPNRVLKRDSICTRDYREDRLNIHVTDEMEVTRVNYG
ncbi:hypothetical protein BY458DRAFT_496930 [Sporodiniella umbellata]|nr:hypothetical protein BY458DRAFT_496930 [Sporodiniella umbellata]